MKLQSNQKNGLNGRITGLNEDGVAEDFGVFRAMGAPMEKAVLRWVEKYY
ncbi:MAG: hypothetical protein ACXWTN_01370 [Methylosarcina sp.]